MVTFSSRQHSDQLDEVFQALSDPTRRQMLHALSRGEATITELAAPFDMSLAAVSKHVKVLEGADLVGVNKRGRSRVCTLQPKALRTAAAAIAHYEKF